MSQDRHDATSHPSAIYVWLVPSEQVLEQPGSWRIRKWDTEPFPEANFSLSGTRDSIIEECAKEIDGVAAHASTQEWLDAMTHVANHIRSLKGKPPVSERTPSMHDMIEARLAWIRDLAKASMPYPGEKGLDGFAAGWQDGFAAGVASQIGAPQGSSGKQRPESTEGAGARPAAAPPAVTEKP